MPLVSGCPMFLKITFGELLIIQDRVSSIQYRFHKAAVYGLSSQMVKHIYATLEFTRSTGLQKFIRQLTDRVSGFFGLHIMGGCKGRRAAVCGGDDNLPGVFFPEIADDKDA